MRYEEFYNEELEKKEKLDKLLHKLPIYGIIAGVLLAIFLVFFFTSGNVTKYEIGRVEYGDSITNQPEAFLGSAEYEFLVNGEYTTIAPQTPGKYTYRVKTKGLFGRVRYSKEYTYTVRRKMADIYCVNEAISYGSEPKAYVRLCEGDTLKSYEFGYASYAMATTKVWVIEESIVIENEAGENVTANYDLNIMMKNITFVDAPVVLKLNPATKVYDGEALTSDSYTLYIRNSSGELEEADNLYYDDKLEITTDGSQIYAGESENKVVDLKVYSTNGVESENYRIECIPSTLTVTPMEINVCSKDVYATFDCQNHDYDTLVSDTEIPDSLESKTKVTTFLDGEYDYELTPIIYNKDRVDVTESYKINPTFGKIYVAKAKATLQPDNMNQEYDGEGVYTDSFTVTEGSIYSASINLMVTSSIREAGDGEISVSKCTATLAGKDITDAFEFTFLKGSIKLTPREITIKPKDATKVYDRTGYTGTQYEITSGSLAKGDILTISASSLDTELGDFDIMIDTKDIKYNGNSVLASYVVTLEKGTVTINQRSLTLTPKNQTIIYGETESMNFTTSGDGLLEGDEVSVTYTYEKNMGSNDITIDDTYTIMNGSIDKKSYYSVTLKTGKLTINKRPITVACVSKTVIYDGNPLGYSPGDCYHKSGELATGDTIQLKDITTMISSAGSKTTQLSMEDVILENAEGEDVSDCYQVTFQNGTLTILKKTAYFISASKTEVFNHQEDPLTCDEYKYYGLCANQTIDIMNTSITGSLDHIGEATNTVSRVVIVDAANNNVTENYNLIIYEGVLTYIERSE